MKALVLVPVLALSLFTGRHQETTHVCILGVAFEPGIGRVRAVWAAPPCSDPLPELMARARTSYWQGPPGLNTIVAAVPDEEGKPTVKGSQTPFADPTVDRRVGPQ